jgi:hypothetical protein
MQRTAALARALWIALVPRAVTDNAVWTGKWDTRWSDGSARIEPTQHGAYVEGVYPLYDGRIVGKRSEIDWKASGSKATVADTSCSFTATCNKPSPPGSMLASGGPACVPAKTARRSATTRPRRRCEAALSWAIARIRWSMPSGRRTSVRPAQHFMRQRGSPAKASYEAVNLTTFRVW